MKKYKYNITIIYSQIWKNSFVWEQRVSYKDEIQLFYMIIAPAFHYQYYMVPLPLTLWWWSQVIAVIEFNNNCSEQWEHAASAAVFLLNRLPSSYLYRQVCKDCATLTLSNSKIHVNCKLKTYYSIFYFIHENVIYDKPEKLQVCTMHAGWVFTAFYIKARTVWMNLLSYIHSFTFCPGM